MPVLLMFPRIDINQIRIISSKSIDKSQKHMLFHQSDMQQTKTKKAGMHHTESQSGDAPKPPFSIKTNKRYEKHKKMWVRSTVEIGPYF